MYDDYLNLINETYQDLLNYLLIIYKAKHKIKLTNIYVYNLFNKVNFFSKIVVGQLEITWLVANVSLVNILN